MGAKTNLFPGVLRGVKDNEKTIFDNIDIYDYDLLGGLGAERHIFLQPRSREFNGEQEDLLLQQSSAAKSQLG